MKPFSLTHAGTHPQGISAFSGDITMDKDEVKSFLLFLENAGWSELLDRQQKLNKALQLVVHEDTKSDIRFCLRLVDEEIAARVEVSRVSEKL
jgi:hypothetical protein